MDYASDVIVRYLCERSQKWRVFRDDYQVEMLISRWRNYIVREDRFNRYAEMTSHGPSHVEGVATLVADLAIPTSFLTDSELLVLFAMAYLHDIGMYHTFDRYYTQPMTIRNIHGPLAMQRILREPHLLLPTLAPDEVRLIALLCSYHQGKAALSDEELASIPPDKRMRFPSEGSGADLLALPEQPSLQRQIETAHQQGVQCFSLKHVQDAICPFLLTTLLKLLDGCDFQASRTGSVEELLRHADRNRSHVLRSARIMKDCPCDSSSYARAEIERDFFDGSVFHLLRNLLIERTFIVSTSDAHRVEIVIKPANPDDVLDVCKRIVEPSGTFPFIEDDTLRHYRQTLEVLRRYQKDPLRTVSQDLKKDPKDDSVKEWNVSVPPDRQGDRRTAHALVARKYIEKELNAVGKALRSPEGKETYHYCGVCPNKGSCPLEHREIPSFNDEDTWNVVMFDPKEHLHTLVGVQSLTRVSDGPNLREMFRRRDTEKALVREIESSKQMLLYGPHGRGKTVSGASLIRDLVHGNEQHRMWYTVEGGPDQIEGFIRSLARFLASNGEFSLENFIRGEHITHKHTSYALNLLASGRLSSRGEAHLALGIDNVNQLTVTSRPFFKRAVEHFICVNCPQASSCKKSEGKRWRCEDARSYVLVLSTKIPGTSWSKIGGIPITCRPAPALSEEEAQTFLGRKRRGEDDADTIYAVWDAYGREPVGMDLLTRRSGSQWDSARVSALFEEDTATFFAEHFDEDGLEGPREVQVMKCVGMLDGLITRAEMDAMFSLKETRDEGALQKLMDRDLIHEEEGKLSAHPAWVEGHHRSRWLDRVGEHPWTILVAFVGLGDRPAHVLRERWETVSPYLWELAVLHDVPGGDHHTWNALEHSLRTLGHVDHVLERLEHALPDRHEPIRAYLQQPVDKKGIPWQNLTRMALLRIAALFHDIGKREAYTEDKGKVSFLQHERIGGETWESIAARHKMPGSQVEYVSTLIRGHLRPLELFGQFKCDQRTDRAVGRLIRDTGELLEPLLILFWADAMASGKMEDLEEQIVAFIGHILDRAEKIREIPARNLPGKDLLDAGLKPGPAFGKALRAANEAWRDNPNLTKEEVIDLAKRVYSEP